MRAVSLKAGCAAGYLHSVLKEGKEPTIDKLLALADALNVSASYLLYGFDVTPDTEELLALLAKNPQARRSILDLLKSQQGA